MPVFSSAASLSAILSARKQVRQLTCEIPATHLLFSNKDIPEKGTQFKHNCVIRSEANRLLLLDFLRMKGVDAVTSNHVGIDPMYKSPDAGNFACSLNGINAMGFSLQALWTVLFDPSLEQRLLDHYIVRLSKWLSNRPADILRLTHERGRILPGLQADLVVWDPYAQSSVHTTHSKFPALSPFVGRELKGVIKQVYLRGQLAFSDAGFNAVGRRVSRRPA